MTSDQGAEQYNTAIESAVNVVFADATKRAQFIGCTPTGQSNDACLRGYIQKLGLRAWRRPLDERGARWIRDARRQRLDDLGQRGRGGSLGDGGAVRVAELPLSPGARAPTRERRASLHAATRWRRGSSFLIWNSLPDQTLLDQAASGTLGTADGIRTAATRMLDATAGRESVGDFAEEYMRLDRIATQAKDPALFPEYGPDLQTAMVRDMRDTWASLAFDDQASFDDLFTTTKVVVNADLARLYGLDATGLTSTTFQTRSLPADGPRAAF